ncbi:uncharacterized protein LOC122196473 [Lactuca sativa]|uniref:uncharacterized protein LOC122196473 n=1 Tax=Lactuca sativa TaxID=4236 RepID=UPI0022AEEABF|nr:uncharacterized protein LOC122196473 [Lactuca sativa]
MLLDPKASKDPQHFKTKNILVESDQYQLGVHRISMVFWVCQRPLYLILSKCEREYHIGCLRAHHIHTNNRLWSPNALPICKVVGSPQIYPRTNQKKELAGF